MTDVLDKPPAGWLVRVPGKHRNADAAWHALHEIIGTPGHRDRFESRERIGRPVSGVSPHQPTARANARPMINSATCGIVVPERVSLIEVDPHIAALMRATLAVRLIGRLRESLAM
jgi:hypothetical protein